MKKTTETRKFKRGEEVHLDEIYDIQGLAGGKWWTRRDGEDDDSDLLVITETITITITASRPSNANCPSTGATGKDYE